MKRFFLLLFLLFIFHSGFSQFSKCGHSALEHQLMEKHPAAIKAIDEAFDNAKENVQKSSADVLTIPVVFHVIYNTDEENLNDSILHDQIAVLNRDFNRENADSTNLRTVFGDIGGNPQIQFKLAGLDPAGNPTSGIHRVKTDKESFLNLDILALLAAIEVCDIDLMAGELTPEQEACLLEEVGGLLDFDEMKFASSGGADAWDVNRYLNIWVCNMSTDLGFLGFAYPPMEAPNWPPDQIPLNIEEVDGIALNYKVVGSNNPNTDMLTQFNDLGRTCVHEVGHYLGLRHIWGDGDCTMDDGIEDTPFMAEQSQVAELNMGCADLDIKDSCTDNDVLPDLYENYMDYSPEQCQNMFTKEQVALMRSMLEGPRKDLLLGDVLDIDEIELFSDFWVFPNPASSQLLIQSSKILNDPAYEIYNIQGSMVAQGNGTVIDVSSFSDGIYYLKLKNEGAITAMKKFVKN